RDPGEHELDRSYDRDLGIGYTDARQQGVADMAEHRTCGVGVLPNEPQADGDDEDRRRIERYAVLEVNGGGEQDSREQSDPRLEGAPKQDLFADSGEERERRDSKRIVERPEKVLGRLIHLVRPRRTQLVAERVRLLDEREKCPCGGKREDDMP